MQQAGGGVGGADHGEAEPGGDREHEQVAERVGAGDVSVRERRRCRRAAAGSMSTSQPAWAAATVTTRASSRLSRSWRIRSRWKAVTAAASTAYASSRGESAYDGDGWADERDRLAEGEQGDAGGQQPAGQPVLGCIAVGPDQHGAGDDDPDQGPGRGMQGVGGDQLVADGEEQHADE